MRLRLATLVALAVTAACSFATSNIKIVDWGNTPPDGTAQINVVPQVIDLTNPDANVTFMNQVWGTRPGIFQFDVKHDYDASFHRTYLLCVELTEGIGDAIYGYKNIAGYAGYLADQIGDVVANPDPGHMKAAALALTTWELNYDAYDPITMTVNVANLDLSQGMVKYIQTNETNAEYATILNYADAYIQGLKNLTPDEVAAYKYRYYENPISSDRKGFQDYIGGVPSPMAALPFLAGIVIALRRKLK